MVQYQPSRASEGAKLSDPGLLSELADEASEDVKFATRETVDKLSTSASNAADKIAATARAAYDKPADIAQYSVRSLKHYARNKPLAALAWTAGIAFVIGAFSALLKR